LAVALKTDKKHAAERESETNRASYAIILECHNYLIPATRNKAIDKSFKNISYFQRSEGATVSSPNNDACLSEWPGAYIRTCSIGWNSH